MFHDVKFLLYTYKENYDLLSPSPAELILTLGLLFEQSW
jgi:hypothetical protein